ncbi:hypothetical protein Scani_33450 [Streptomyces caniferus]|uniref:Uncharacterized protein n=1 Tax=Streptomyces caniferus TaxID=285557 RepID=A0A640S7R7_9ACTN|nr:hypothetical protein Scani_33450 [Streptomyces caniferus]
MAPFAKRGCAPQDLGRDPGPESVADQVPGLGPMIQLTSREGRRASHLRTCSALGGANDDGYLPYTTLERDGGPVVSDALPRCGVLRERKTCRSAGTKSPIAPADRATRME